MVIDLKDKLHTSTQVADILGVSLRTLYRYMEDGRIYSMRTASGRHRFTKEQILAFLNGGNVDSSPAPETTHSSGQSQSMHHSQVDGVGIDTMRDAPTNVYPNDRINRNLSGVGMSTQNLGDNIQSSQFQTQPSRTGVQQGHLGGNNPASNVLQTGDGSAASIQVQQNVTPQANIQNENNKNDPTIGAQSSANTVGNTQKIDESQVPTDLRDPVQQNSMTSSPRYSRPVDNTDTSAQQSISANQKNSATTHDSVVGHGMPGLDQPTNQVDPSEVQRGRENPDYSKFNTITDVQGSQVGGLEEADATDTFHSPRDVIAPISKEPSREPVSKPASNVNMSAIRDRLSNMSPVNEQHSASRATVPSFTTPASDVPQKRILQETPIRHGSTQNEPIVNTQNVAQRQGNAVVSNSDSNASAIGNRQIRLYTSEYTDLMDLAKRVSKVSSAKAMDYAFTLYAGLSLHFPIKPFAELHFYAYPEDLIIWEEELKLNPATEKKGSISILLHSGVSFVPTASIGGYKVVGNDYLLEDLSTIGESALVSQFRDHLSKK